MSARTTSPGERLPAPFGARIERDRPLGFFFQGRPYSGFAGDTVASALYANGVHVLSRSFKYHRPRGVFSAAGWEANTLVQIGDEPNVYADRRLVEEGLRVTAQNYTGSLERDAAAVLDRLGRFMPVGFYYKAFYKPKWAWPLWARLIRKSAGLGRVNRRAPHGYYDKAYRFCDVAIVGGGAAGLAAALEAAASGAEVLLIEEEPALGGALAYGRFGEDRAPIETQLDALATEVANAAGIEVMTGAVCTGLFTDNWLAVVRGNRLYKLRAKAVVLATGAYEQPMVFRNNDLPGIMLSGAAQRLMGLYGVRPGTRAVLATANDDGYGCALDLLDAGVSVSAIADARPEAALGAIAETLRERGVPVLAGSAVTEALPAPGHKGVRGARVSRLDADGAAEAALARFDCDLVVTSMGYNPILNLAYQAGADVAYDEARAMFLVRTLPEGIAVAGAANGVFDLDATVADGCRAGWQAARAAGLDGGAEPAAAANPGGATRNHPWPVFPHPKGRDFVDFDEDLQVKDIFDAVAEGYEGIELVKRFSTVGMGPSQGKHSAVTAARLAARAMGEAAGAVGTSTTRPPYRAEKFGVLAGRSFEPVRHTAMHARHLEAGARMVPAGLWLRPAYYGSPEMRERAIRDEALNVRGNVGLIDVSTLGGLEVRGPDAAEFMNRMYTFAYLKQPVGRCRYVLMTDIAGVIVDDGVAVRLHDHHFYVTATTGGVDGVYRSMLWHNVQWRLDVDVTNVTVAYAGVNIAGPKSRAVLARLCDDVELGAEAFPYMGAREGHVAGIPARMIRVGFVGELGYEIHVAADHGEALWDALIKAGEADGIRPFGVEAQRLLRLEKGHIIINQDTDGLTTPEEADMAWAISRKKPYFVGKRSLEIQEANGLTRKLVGFTIADVQAPVPEECHLVLRGDEITGRVTSAAFSPALEKTVGLAYVAPDQAAEGEEFDIKVDRGRVVRGRVSPLPFYDPENRRQEM